MFWSLNDKKDKNKEDDYYNRRSHQDVYFKDTIDRRNNLQYCSFCDCYRGFMYDRCSHCKNQ